MRSKRSDSTVFFTLSAAILAIIVGVAYSFAGIGDKTGQRSAAELMTARNPALAVSQAGSFNAEPVKITADRAAIGAVRDKTGVYAGGNSKSLAGAENNKRGILNGYKGYRYRRPGYKSAGDGWWYPRAAFAAKSAVLPFVQQPGKGAKTAQAGKNGKAAPAGKGKAAGRAGSKHRLATAMSAHKSWCAEHYPSYRSADNSYSLSNGSRRACHSPYME